MASKHSGLYTVEQWASAQRQSTPQERQERLLSLIHSYSANDPAWISIATDDQIISQLENANKLDQSSSQSLPLFGVPFAVKDNIDADGFNTTAACPAYSFKPSGDSTVVAALRANGAIVVGKTNLDQFATGLVGTRSPYGIPSSAFSDKHVSGGSSSGSASVVSRGLVPFSLGTDTAGSGRVPAMLNNLIGLKPTRGMLSCNGVVPACKSLDCVSIFALNISEAGKILSIATKFDAQDPYSRPTPQDALSRLLPAQPLIASVKDPLFFDDDQNPALYEKAIEDLRATGAKVEAQDFSILFKLAACLYEGPWVAERYAAIREFINRESAEKDMDPTVYKIVKSAENFVAADAYKYEYMRLEILRKVEEIFGKYDAFIVPTAPKNPTIASVQDEPVLVNSRQGTYTNFVNLADFSALAIPAGFRPKDNLPFGVTLISKKFNDYALLDLAQRYLKVSAPQRTMGAISAPVANGDVIPKPETPAGTIAVSVVGAHLSGMPLNSQLVEANATLSKSTKTSSNYRLYALPRSSPPKPGLRRVTQNDNLKGESILVEVYDLPIENFGAFVSKIPHPLGIGTVELEDGTWVKGFICEQVGYNDPEAKDITHHGGWRSYISSLSS